MINYRVGTLEERKVSKLNMRKNILITGRPRVGKTTLVVEAIKDLNVPFCGFYTRELIRDDKRIGFVINNLRGERGIFAHIDSDSEIRVSKYGVELDVLEIIGVAELERCTRDVERKVIVIDEIGKMELFSDKFKSAVIRALDSPFPVLATIMVRGDEWVESIFEREDVKIFTINVNNRKQVKEKVEVLLPQLLFGTVREEIPERENINAGGKK